MITQATASIRRMGTGANLQEGVGGVAAPAGRRGGGEMGRLVGSCRPRTPDLGGGWEEVGRGVREREGLGTEVSGT